MAMRVASVLRMKIVPRPVTFGMKSNAQQFAGKRAIDVVLDRDATQNNVRTLVAKVPEKPEEERQIAQRRQALAIHLEMHNPAAHGLELPGLRVHRAPIS